MSYEYLGERLADGSVLALYRKGDDGYFKYDVESDSWKRSGEAQDAFFGEIVTRRLDEDEVNSEIAAKKENYKKYLAKYGK